MESQTNYPPQAPQSQSSGLNTVLLVVVILILAGVGYWWFMGRVEAPTEQQNDPGINIDVTIPAGSDTGGTSGEDMSAQ